MGAQFRKRRFLTEFRMDSPLVRCAFAAQLSRLNSNYRSWARTWKACALITDILMLSTTTNAQPGCSFPSQRSLYNLFRDIFGGADARWLCARVSVCVRVCACGPFPTPRLPCFSHRISRGLGPLHPVRSYEGRPLSPTAPARRTHNWLVVRQSEDLRSKRCSY